MIETPRRRRLLSRSSSSKIIPTGRFEQTLLLSPLFKLILGSPTCRHCIPSSGLLHEQFHIESEIFWSSRIVVLFLLRGQTVRHVRN